MKKLVVGITGASGVLYGVRLLECLKTMDDVHTSLIMSDAARANLAIETGLSPEYVEGLADAVYAQSHMAAPVASGSYRTDAVVITPCSMKTLSAIAHGYSDTLLVRAADVAIKEGRKLILAPRETPLSAIHLRNMLALAELGVCILPPIPAFYHAPATIDDLLLHHVMKIMDQLGLPFEGCARWEGA